MAAWWQRTWFIAAILFLAVLLNNSELVFKTPLYEADDYAVNSLQILKAKQCHETLGNYCRFGFHHPGPAFFYLFGWGELVFFDAARIVPTPFNGQLIAFYFLSAFFFGATLALVARDLNEAARGWFVGLALLFAAWHFGAVGRFYQFVPEQLGFLTPWPPCFIVLPFLCFLVAAASVAAGNGRDLPLMTLAGCFLIHGHVAMPLFVVPTTLLAYGVLWRENRRAEGSRPWKLFRRQHWLAAATIGLFLLPITIDLLTARPSNLERVVEHLRTGYGEPKGLLQSLLYFLHFGGYRAYPRSQPIPAFETFDAAGLRSFFLLHWRAHALWIASVFAVIAIRTTPQPSLEQAWKLRRRLYLILGAGAGLSIVWGCIQEGPMFDYNGLINFAIYYAWLLVVALSLAVWIQQRCPARIRTASLTALTLIVVVAFARERRRFRGIGDGDEQRQFAAAIERALILDPVQPKFLNFDARANSQAERIAVYLERRAIQWWVREDWPLIFGAERILKPGRTDQPIPTVSSSFWHVALHAEPADTGAGENAVVLPLNGAFDLVIYPGK